MEGSADTGVLTVGNWDLAAMMDGRTRADWRGRKRDGRTREADRNRCRRNSAECCWRRKKKNKKKRRKTDEKEEDSKENKKA